VLQDGGSGKVTLPAPTGEDYSALTVVRAADMVPPQEHLSDEAATRTIWALTYMVNLFRVWGGASHGPASRTMARVLRPGRTTPRPG
jgi:hypothetical protein